MTTECSSTADAMTGVLMAGDVILNLSQQPLNATAGSVLCASVEDRVFLSHTLSEMSWRFGTSFGLHQLPLKTFPYVGWMTLSRPPGTSQGF